MRKRWEMKCREVGPGMLSRVLMALVYRLLPAKGETRGRSPSRRKVLLRRRRIQTARHFPLRHELPLLELPAHHRLGLQTPPRPRARQIDGPEGARGPAD